LEAGAAIDSQNIDGATALMFASGNGHVTVVAAMLEEGAAVDSQDKDGHTALMRASGNGHVAVVAALLEAGAAVDHQNKNGATALMAAALNGHVEVVRALLKAGATVDHQDKVGRTALMYARRYNNTQSVNDNSGTDLRFSVGNYYVVRELLLKLAEGDASRAVHEINKIGEILNSMRNNDGQPLLMFAIRNNKKSLFNIFLQCEHLDLETRDPVDATALIIAVDKHRPGMMGLLLQKGADVNAASEGGITGLMRAGSNGYMGALEYLIEHNSNINAQSDKWHTALMFARRNESRDSAKLLLRHGADPELKDNQGNDCIEECKTIACLKP
jgi:ankyrin repeat protein